jgi:arylsulfatase A-like enzyme
MDERPNILLITTDHQAYYRHGWDGGPLPQRPNFDRLASEGVRFTHAYTACPLCMPVRRTMLTGVFPHRHGLLHNDENQRAAPYAFYFAPLATQGYRNFCFGKWHAGPPGSARDHGCEGLSYPSFGNPYATSEYRDYIQRCSLPTAEHYIESVFGRWRDRLRPGDRHRGADGWPDGFGLTLTPRETHEAFFLASLACDQLRQVADGKQPFALRVDFWGPHHPHFPTQEFADLYDPAAIPEYGSFRDDLAGKPDVYRTNHWAPFGQDGRLIQPSALPWSEWQKLIARAYANITMIDAASGLILDTLDELGLKDNTLVVWTADHGDALASHGGQFDKGSYLTEEVIRIPLAVRWPAQVPAGQVCEHLVSLIDLAPTFLDAARARCEHQTDGTSFLPLCYGTTGAWRADLMCENHGYGDDVVARALITNRYKYVTTSGQRHELYDLLSDPYELANLIDEPDLASTREELQRRLADWRQRTGDTIEA